MANKRVRIQPKQVVVREDCPFINDLLDREEYAEALADTLAAIEGPGVFAIDGGWGTGKTTFVRMFSQHLRNQGFRVVDINAWETDYADSPLAALVSKIAEEEPDRSRRDKFKVVGIQALKAALPAAAKIATYGLLDFGAASERAVGDALGKFAESGLARFEEDAECMAKFKEGLEALAARDQDKPLVVVVDELDRCRPTYAVEMLETIKHAFDVDNLLFVLAVNRNQLDQSAKTIYGEFLDPETYFRRFFDCELKLPEPEKKSVVRHLLGSVGLPSRGIDSDFFADVLGQSPYGIRRLEQTVRHYGLVAGPLRSQLDRRDWWWLLQFVVLWRLVAEGPYHAFIAGTETDAALMDGFFSVPWTDRLRGGNMANLMAATAIVATETRPSEDGVRQPSQLLSRYRSEEPDRPETASDQTVLGHYALLKEKRTLAGWPFWTVVRKVEMLDIGRAAKA